MQALHYFKNFILLSDPFAVSALAHIFLIPIAASRCLLARVETPSP